MRHIFTTAAAACAAICLGTAVQAMTPAPVATSAGARLAPTLIAEGCGPAFHRGPAGRCVPNGVFAPRRVCPRGTHLGPEGRACRPNF